MTSGHETVYKEYSTRSRGRINLSIGFVPWSSQWEMYDWSNDSRSECRNLGFSYLVIILNLYIISKGNKVIFLKKWKYKGDNLEREGRMSEKKLKEEP